MDENAQSAARKPPASPEAHLNSSGEESTRCILCAWERGELER